MPWPERNSGQNGCCRGVATNETHTDGRKQLASHRRRCFPELLCEVEALPSTWRGVWLYDSNTGNSASPAAPTPSWEETFVSVTPVQAVRAKPLPGNSKNEVWAPLGLHKKVRCLRLHAPTTMPTGSQVVCVEVRVWWAGAGMSGWLKQMQGFCSHDCLRLSSEWSSLFLHPVMCCITFPTTDSVYGGGPVRLEGS